MKVKEHKSAFLCTYSDENTEEMTFIALSDLPPYTMEMPLKFSFIETIVYRNISKHQGKNSLEFYEIDIECVNDPKYKGFKVFTPENMLDEDKVRIVEEIDESNENLKPPSHSEIRRFTEAYKLELEKKNVTRLSKLEVKELKSRLHMDHIQLLDKTWMNE
ncbi:MAG: hypothetical protein JXR88_04120 [Clostridia bacterium]|nr:hypothetical protein [Clostridia bacterium]